MSFIYKKKQNAAYILILKKEMQTCYLDICAQTDSDFGKI